MAKKISLSDICGFLFIAVFLHVGCNNIPSEPGESVTQQKCLQGSFKYYESHIDDCLDIAKEMDDQTKKGKVYYIAASSKHAKLHKLFKKAESNNGDYRDLSKAADEVIALYNKALECDLDAGAKLKIWESKSYAYAYRTEGDMKYLPEIEREVINCQLHLLLFSITNQKENEIIQYEKYPICSEPYGQVDYSKCFETYEERTNYVEEQNRIIEDRFSYTCDFISYCLDNRHGQKEKSKKDCLELIDTYVVDQELKNELIYYVREETVPKKLGHFDIPELK